eukprot:CAMPEP_0169463500 /NCGR_PEP_ID=MMETSP1042-20121227/20146_1 /TAXON_ID=464988 /ORGANISM="Hemiselmis andersenii, Strain CCMP1180" /LENGTH=68 /DNA_ID=CAMNT_0009576247 /DNA_START=58 /DNA_END=261 /DNA_ORIENTATION=+
MKKRQSTPNASFGSVKSQRPMDLRIPTTEIVVPRACISCDAYPSLPASSMNDAIDICSDSTIMSITPE